MFEVHSSRYLRNRIVAAIVVLFAMVFALPNTAQARKKEPAPQPKNTKQFEMDPSNFDFSKLVWPEPPDIARIRYVTFYVGEKIERDLKKATPKTTWMDRLAGKQPLAQNKKFKVPFQLVAPYGLAVDSKGLVYAADQRVGAIFIINMQTGQTQLIRNGYDATFKLLNGLAIDDDDRLFVSDGDLGHVLVFNAQHKQVDVIREGMVHPNGLAIDTENRLLYVVDTDLDQVLVYDADSFKLLRKIGTTGHNHTLTTPGDFSQPTNVALDKEGNIYVTDTLNDRVEMFDPDGDFIGTFGKNCDGPACFQRPKGIAVDSDGHIWVVDTVQAMVKIFNKDGRLLAYVGQYGRLPGEFSAATGIAIDKQNRVLVSEQQPGRIQVFRYVTDAQAAAEKTRREEDRVEARHAEKSGGPSGKSDTGASGTKSLKTSAPAASEKNGAAVPPQ